MSHRTANRKPAAEAVPKQKTRIIFKKQKSLSIQISSDSIILAPCTSQFEFAFINFGSGYHCWDVNMNFKPFWDEPSKSYIPILPIFNRDSKFWSPAFILPTEKENLASFEKKFRQRARDYNMSPKSEQNSIFLPQKQGPAKCKVCFCNFQDYWEHVQNQEHKKSLKLSLGSKYIRKLIRKIRKNREKAKNYEPK